MRTLALLIVGDEILKGEVRDENGPYLIERARQHGVEVVRQVIAPDTHEALCVELPRLRSMAEAVVLSGGIGPTHDDVTRQALAEVLDAPLERHAEAEARLRGFYRDEVTAAELTMADLPRGAQLVSGCRTGAFGFECQGVYGFPGVPSLFCDLVDALDEVFTTQPMAVRELRSERREGELAPVLAAAQRDALDVAIGSYPVMSDGLWHVRVVLRGSDPARVASVARSLQGHL